MAVRPLASLNAVGWRCRKVESGSLLGALDLPGLLLIVSTACWAAQPLSAQQIRGRVVESELLKPVAAATVSLLDRDMAVRVTAHTDSAGNFLFDTLTPGLYLVQAQAGGRFSSISPPISPSSEDSIVVVVPSIIYELAGSCGFVSGTETVLAGIVRADGTGVPLPGAQVTLHWEGGPSESVSTTDAAGRYRFCGVPAGRLVHLQMSAFGRSRSVTIMVPDATLSRADLSLELEIGASSLRIVGTRPIEAGLDKGQVSGRVLDIEGNIPIADVVVRVGGASTTAISDEDGSFILPNVKEGDVVLEIEHLSFGTHRELLPIRRGLAVDVELLLAARPVALQALQVEGRSAASTAARMSVTRFDGFSGALLAAAESRGERVIELVRTLPGVTVMEGMFTTRQGLQSGYCLTTSRRLATLRPSPGGSSNAPWCESIPVYVDDVLVADGVAFLRSLSIADYESVQLLHPTDAHIRYGLAAGAAGGALVLWTRGRGPHVSQERQIPRPH